MDFQYDSNMGDNRGGGGGGDGIPDRHGPSQCMCRPPLWMIDGRPKKFESTSNRCFTV